MGRNVCTVNIQSVPDLHRYLCVAVEHKFLKLLQNEIQILNSKVEHVF